MPDKINECPNKVFAVLISPLSDHGRYPVGTISLMRCFNSMATETVGDQYGDLGDGVAE